MFYSCIYTILGQTIDKTSNRFAHKKGSIASRINAEILSKSNHSPEKKRKKGSSFSYVSKASSDSGVSSDQEVSHDRRKRSFEEEENINHSDRDSRRRQDNDEHEDEIEYGRDKSYVSYKSRDLRTPERRGGSAGRHSIGFYDDGEERRQQSWERERGSVKNSLDNSLFLSPRNNNLSDSFSSSRPSRLESIPEAWLVFPEADKNHRNNYGQLNHASEKNNFTNTRAIPLSLRHGIGSRLQVMRRKNLFMIDCSWFLFGWFIFYIIMIKRPLLIKVLIDLHD